MAERELTAVKKAIIANATIPRNPTELVDDILEYGFKEKEIRESIWHLIDSRDLELSASRTLMAGDKHPHQLYLMPEFKSK